MLTLSRVDATARTHELTATTQGNNGNNIVPTLALFTGQRRTAATLADIVSNTDDIETTQQNCHIEDDAGICFMQPYARDERINQQPAMSFLNLHTYYESTRFATRTQVFHWSFLSNCAAELQLTEGSKHTDNWICSFTPCSHEGDASRSTDEYQASTSTK